MRRISADRAKGKVREEAVLWREAGTMAQEACMLQTEMYELFTGGKQVV